MQWAFVFNRKSWFDCAIPNLINLFAWNGQSWAELCVLNKDNHDARTHLPSLPVSWICISLEDLSWEFLAFLFSIQTNLLTAAAIVRRRHLAWPFKPETDARDDRRLAHTASALICSVCRLNYFLIAPARNSNLDLVTEKFFCSKVLTFTHGHCLSGSRPFCVIRLIEEFAFEVDKKSEARNLYTSVWSSWAVPGAW